VFDGAFLCGTTGEGVLLTVDERRRVAEGFVRARASGFGIAVHAGAQSTPTPVALRHPRQGDRRRRRSQRDRAAVLPAGRRPRLFEHLRSAAEACGGLPFYVYEFAARSG
jgi:N-acetylneuraminate lyase